MREALGPWPSSAIPPAGRRCASSAQCRDSAPTSTTGPTRRKARLEREAVSFDKGCYLGQEVVCMLELRGHVKRKLVPVVVEAGQPPAIGAAVTDEQGRRLARSPARGVSHARQAGRARHGQARVLPGRQPRARRWEARRSGRPAGLRVRPSSCSAGSRRSSFQGCWSLRPGVWSSSATTIRSSRARRRRRPRPTRRTATRPHASRTCSSACPRPKRGRRIATGRSAISRPVCTTCRRSSTRRRPSTGNSAPRSSAWARTPTSSSPSAEPCPGLSTTRESVSRSCDAPRPRPRRAWRSSGTSG